LQVALQQERALAQQSRTLVDLLQLREQVQLDTVAAAVIAGSASPDFRTLTIDKGTADGIRPDMAVIAPAGVVGRIITPSARAAKVQLLIDRNAAAGAMVERSRAQGVVEGTGGDLRLNYVSGTADVRSGDVVITSGIDGIYPKGFVLGQIESVERSAGGFGAIVIRPAVEFSSIEAVLVVVTPPVSGLEGPVPSAVEGPAIDQGAATEPGTQARE
jgi:rod shape-determining protein MreC